jgi:hypothetical protein
MTVKKTKVLVAKWIEPESVRPIAGQKIIFVDAVGMFSGVYQPIKTGVVYVDGKMTDAVDWEDVYQWIPYPTEP